MLEGYDQEWKEVNNSCYGIALSYTNVPPGKYKLKSAYSKANGEWSDIYEWTFVVRPPTYRTWWAYCIYIIVGIGITLVIWLAIRKYRALILRLREKRNKYIIQANEVKHEEMQLKDHDKEILDKAASFVNANLSDSEYGVEQLSRDMGMSRSTLYRTLQNIVAQTPTDFIITIRCRGAAQMLGESKQQIKEIAVNVGFNDVRYFRKAFNKIYGMTPQEYRRNNSTPRNPNNPE